MGFLGGALGTTDNYSSNIKYKQQDPTINNAVQPSDAYKAMQRNQMGLDKQDQFVAALGGQNGLLNQQSIFAQQQALANQLGQQAQGAGPNPALAQLHQQTAQNIANQGALMASQRGAGANAGLLSRQAALQGGNIQQQAAGQEATMQAQQQLAAQNALMQQQNALQNVAGQQIGTQAGAMQNYNQNLQGNQGQVIGALGAQNQLASQNALGNNQINADIAKSNNLVNAGIAQTNAGTNASMVGGLLGAAGTLGAAALKGPAAAAAHGGMIGHYAEGGQLQYQGASPEEQHARAQQAQNGFLASAQDNPVSRAVNWLTGSNAPQSTTGQRVASGMANGGQVNMQQGGHVPGQAKVSGDSYSNDTVPAMLSPGEVVIPRHIMQGKNPAKDAAAFVAQVLAKKKVVPKHQFENGGMAVSDDGLPAGAPTEADVEEVTPVQDTGAQQKMPQDLSTAIHNQTDPNQYVDIANGEAPAAPAKQSLAEVPSKQAPGLMSAIKKGMTNVGAGITGASAAQQEMGSKEAAYVNQAVTDRQNIEDKYQQERKPLEQRRAERLKDYQNGHLTPGDFFTGKSTGQQIGTAIALALGGIGAGLTHGENPVLKYLNGQLENDMKAQEYELGKKKNLLADSVEDLKNLHDAKIDATAAQRDIVELQLKKAVAEATSPLAKANGMKALGEWQIESAQKILPLQLKEAAVNSLKNGGDPVAAAKFIIPNEQDQKQFAQEVENRDLIAKNLPRWRKLWEQAQQENTALRTGAGYRPPQSYNTLLSEILPVLHAENVRATPEMLKIKAEGILPQPGRLDSSQNAIAKPAFEDTMTKGMDSPTARRYQIPLAPLPVEQPKLSSDIMEMANKHKISPQAMLKGAEARLARDPNDQNARAVVEKFGGQ